MQPVITITATITTKPPKPKAGKPMPYFCSNHTLPKTYQYHYPTKPQYGGGYRWLVHPFFTLRGDVVERVTNLIRGKQQDFVRDAHLRDVVFPRMMTRNDLRPVLNTELVNLAAELSAEEKTVDQVAWNLITLPPDPVGDDADSIPGTDHLPNILCFDELENRGLVLVKVNPVFLGWCLFHFQDFDTNLEWWVSLKEAGLYLKEGGEIKAVVKLLQLHNSPTGVK